MNRFTRPVSLLIIVFTSSTLFSQSQIDFVYGIGANHWQVKMAADAKEEGLLKERIHGQFSKPEQRIGINYRFKGKFPISLRTGMRFLVSGFRTYDLMSLENEEKKQLRMSAVDKNTNKIKFDYDYFFLELPFVGRWVYSEHGCDAFVEAGASLNGYLGTRVRTSESDLNEDRESKIFSEQVNPLHVKLLFSTGVSTELAAAIPVFIQLVGSYQLNPIKNGVWEERSFGFGIETGVRWQF